MGLHCTQRIDCVYLEENDVIKNVIEHGYLDRELCYVSSEDELNIFDKNDIK